MNICIIPARGGSKRIPHKNIKKFNGKPIIAYSIEAAIKSKCFDEVVVSTDDDQISEVAKKYGASVPFVRPKKLSNDFTETLPVIKHAIKFLNKDKPIKYVCCLYATAPFIQPEVIKNAFDVLKTQTKAKTLDATTPEQPKKKLYSIAVKTPAKTPEKKAISFDDEIATAVKAGRPKGSKNKPKEIDPTKIPPAPQSKQEKEFFEKNKDKIIQSQKGIKVIDEIKGNPMFERQRTKSESSSGKEGEGKGRRKNNKHMKKYNINDILKKLNRK